MMPGLAHIMVESGTAQDADGSFRGFLTVTATAHTGDEWKGQLSPAEVRGMALDWLGAAEAAEQDAIVFTIATRELELQPNEAAHLVRRIRDHRVDPRHRHTPT